MFPPYPQETAYHYCMELISQIEKGNIVLKRISQESEERKNLGVMLGCLVGYEAKSKKRIIIYAVSGNRYILKKRLSEPEGICKYIIAPPIVSYKKAQSALKKNDKQIHLLSDQINKLKELSETKQNINSINDTVQQASINKNSNKALELTALEIKRTKLTDESLQKIFNLFKFYKYDGKKIKLQKIISEHNGKLPPTGTGECCAPKLLNFAFKNNIKIISMTELYYGNSKNKASLTAYPPCDERCGYILPFILGLEILYKDNDIVVAVKPSGLLSVPGKKEKDCAESRIKKLYADFIEQGMEEIAAHRLDMETSGIMIFALNKFALENLHKQFREKLVQKEYVALLDGILYGKNEGCVQLKTRLDTENRPYQIYDEINGKNGITEWKKIGIETLSFKNKKNQIIKKKVTRIAFYPKTGRTHQLRLASADEHGLNIPIVGDSLYGKKDAPRLYLHAKKITFFHPVSNRKMTFESKEPY